MKGDTLEKQLKSTPNTSSMQTDDTEYDSTEDDLQLSQMFLPQEQSNKTITQGDNNNNSNVNDNNNKTDSFYANGEIIPATLDINNNTSFNDYTNKMDSINDNAQMALGATELLQPKAVISKTTIQTRRTDTNMHNVTAKILENPNTCVVGNNPDKVPKSKTPNDPENESEKIAAKKQNKAKVANANTNNELENEIEKIQHKTKKKFKGTNPNTITDDKENNSANTNVNINPDEDQKSTKISNQKQQKATS